MIPTAPQTAPAPEAADPPRLFLATFGCQMNEYDSGRMRGLLAAAGFQDCASAEEAQVIVVNTCSVRQLASHKALSLLGYYKALKERRPGVIIAVTGCLAQQEGDKLLKKMPHLDLVVGPNALEELPRLVAEAREAAARHRRRRQALVPPRTALPSLVVPPQAPGLKAFVTVMQGCDNFCSYCVVPYLRGREQSRPAAQVVAEVAGLAAAGVREITLLGQNVNSYLDPAEGGDFAELLTQVADINGIVRVRFTTSHPKDLSPRLMDAMADIPEVMESIHLPVQSGSDAVLKAMGRGYTAGEYLERLTRLRERVPGVTVTTDMIAGFPGETEADFAATLELTRIARFDDMFSFRYSDRPLTKARKLPGKLEHAVKARRLAELQALQLGISLELHQGLEGSRREVLVEGPAKKGQAMYTGRTRGGQTVNFESEQDLSGKLVEVVIMEGREHSLTGRLAGSAQGELS